MFQQGSIKANNNTQEEEDAVLRLCADQWLVEHIEAIGKHISSRLKSYKLGPDDREELTSRAMLEAIELVYEKAFVPQILGGFGDDPVGILKQLKTRLNYYILDEAKALARMSSGRRKTDAYDAATRAPTQVEDDDGNEADIWDVLGRSSYDSLNTYAPSPEEILLHKEFRSIIEGCCEDYRDELLLSVILEDLSLNDVVKALGVPQSTLSSRKAVLTTKINDALREAGYAG